MTSVCRRPAPMRIGDMPVAAFCASRSNQPIEPTRPSCGDDGYGRRKRKRRKPVAPGMPVAWVLPTRLGGGETRRRRQMTVKLRFDRLALAARSPDGVIGEANGLIPCVVPAIGGGRGAWRTSRTTSTRPRTSSTASDTRSTAISGSERADMTAGRGEPALPRPVPLSGALDEVDDLKPQNFLVGMEMRRKRNMIVPRHTRETGRALV